MTGTPHDLFTDGGLTEILRRRLARSGFPVEDDLYPRDFFDAPPRPAAVLMPLLMQNDGWHLIFIRRARNHKDRHSGQVAFPGGHVETLDHSEEAAALREAEEEIGLSPGNVDLLGRMGSYRTISNFSVTPILGWVHSHFAPQPDPSEVEHVFSIPLRWLADPANLNRRSRALPGTDATIDVLYFRDYEGELLWGITARLVAALIEGINTHR